MQQYEVSTEITVLVHNYVDADSQDEAERLGESMARREVGGHEVLTLRSMVRETGG